MTQLSRQDLFILDKSRFSKELGHANDDENDDEDSEESNNSIKKKGYDDVTFFVGGNAAHYAPWWNESEIRTITEKKRDMYKTNLRSMFKYLTGLAPVR